MVHCIQCIPRDLKLKYSHVDVPQLLKIDSCLIIADSYEVQFNAAFHLGLHCLPLIV